MVSKARLDLPEPESPVMTISASRGSSRSMSLRLCSRAPEMTIRSEAATTSILRRRTDVPWGESLHPNALGPGMREEMRSHRALAEIAERQYGVVTTAQLRGLGFSSSAISRASFAGRLHRVHRGVYSIGYRQLGRHGRCLTTVLACGDGACLSHEAAAWLWGLLPWCPKVVDVTVPGAGRSRPGIRLHHAPALAAD